jgi:hypothetical protein
LNSQDDPFVVDDEVEARLAAAYPTGNLDDLRQHEIIGAPFPIAVKAEKLRLCRQALTRLEQLDEQAASLFYLTVNAIFTRDHRVLPGISRSLGGSSSNAIGVVWVSLASLTDPADVTELFVHELTHHLLFIDELNYGHFNYAKIPLRENFARSAVLRRSRPLDKVVHSIAVGTEILLLRRRYEQDEWRPSLHPHSAQLRMDILESIRSVEALSNLDDLISRRVRDLLDRCVGLVEGGSELHASEDRVS